MFSRLSLLFVVSLCISSCYAQAIGAFYSIRGSTVVSLNGESGNFSYNVVGRTGLNASSVMTPIYPPMLNTSIAVVGYSNNASIWGSIFYQTTNNSLAQQLFKCVFNAGTCVPYPATGLNAYIISNNVSVPVKPGTSIAASLLSTNFGYRVTYEDINGSLRQLSYSATTSGETTWWGEGALISEAKVSNGSALATAYTSSTDDSIPANQTVYQYSNGQILPFVNNNVNFINATADNIWVTDPPTSSLTDFDPKNGTFATTFYKSSTSFWRCLFYIDTKRQLQYVRAVNSDPNWSLQPIGTEAQWPLADTPSAPITAATSLNGTTISIYYVSDNNIVQVSMSYGNSASKYVVVAPVVQRSKTSVTTSFTPTATPTPSSSSTAQSASDERAIKIGASVGSAVAFLLLLGILVLFLTRHLRRTAAPSTSDSQEAITQFHKRGSAYEFTGKSELHSDSTQIYELDHDPECLLLHQLQAYRMYEARGVVPAEIEGVRCTGGRAELDHGLCKCELDAAVISELPAFLESCRSSSDGNGGGEGAIRTGVVVVERSAKSKGKEKDENAFSMKGAVVQLPMWSWAILRREAAEQGMGMDLEKGLDLDLNLNLELGDNRGEVVSPIERENDNEMGKEKGEGIDVDIDRA